MQLFSGKLCCYVFLFFCDECNTVQTPAPGRWRIDLLRLATAALIGAAGAMSRTRSRLLPPGPVTRQVSLWAAGLEAGAQPFGQHHTLFEDSYSMEVGVLDVYIPSA